MCVPVWDTQAPDSAQIDAAVAWAQHQLAEGHPLYVHCAHGHGRSATVLAALLIATGRAASAEEAVSIMRYVTRCSTTALHRLLAVLTSLQAKECSWM
jgi:protein-tyrosine phosphatase